MKKRISFILLFISILSVNTIYAFEAENIEIHGFISQGYLLTDKNNYLVDTEDGTFEFNEMGINFSTDVTDTLHIGMQFFARDLGSVGNNEVVLDWAFGDYRWKNWLGLRAGMLKIDYGMYNETREMDMLRTGIMLPQSVYPELWRDSFARIKGFALYGYTPLSFMGDLSYDFQIGEMDFKSDEGFVRSQGPRQHETLNITDMDADYAWFASLRWNTPLKGLKTKGSYYEIKNLTENGDVNITLQDNTTVNSQITYEFTEKDGYILSLEYTWNNLVIAGEYSEDNYQVKMSEESNIPTPSDQNNAPQVSPPKITSEGWYVSAAYRFTDWLELGGQYSEYYPDADNKHGNKKDNNFNSWLKTTTLSTRFDINDYWILKLEASYNDGFGGINLAENSDTLEQYWLLFAAKMTFSF